jgi:hypothetical protein
MEGNPSIVLNVLPISIGRFSAVPHWPLLGVPRGMGEMFALFDKAAQLFEDDSNTWPAMRYVRTPLPIPLAPDAVASLMKHAGSREEFSAEIDRRVDLQEMYINGML